MADDTWTLRSRQKGEQTTDSTEDPKRDRERVIANTREMLELARAGLRDATGRDPRRRRAGLMNLFTFGRSVTLTMQTMKSVDPSFRDWWEPYQSKIGGDPLMKFFTSQRNAILKEGELSTATITHFSFFDGRMMQEINRHAPPGTVRTFIGDHLGGSGWDVELPDGSTRTVYFSLPDNSGVEVTLHFPHPPTEHNGQEITDASVGNIGGLYIAALDKIVVEFVERFGL